MPLTVRESLELEPLKSVRVLAGGKSLDRTISSASIIEVPDVWKWLHGNEMLLTTLYPFRDSIEAQLNLIRQLSSRHVACLVVKLHRFVESLSPDVIELAEKEALPLLELPPHVSFIDVLNAVLRRVWNRDLDAMIESERVGREALNMVAEGKGIQALVSFMAQSLRNPVSFHDPEGKLVAVTSDKSAEKVLASLEKLEIKKLASLAETSRTIFEIAELSTRTEGDPDAAQQPVPDMQHSGKLAEPRLVVPAEAKGRRYGYLAIWESSPLPPTLPKLADSFALAAALEMARDQATKEVELRHISHFVREIVSGTITEEVARQQAGALGIRIGTWNLVLSISVTREIRGGPLGEASMEMVTRESVLRYNPAAVTAIVGKHVVVLWPVSGDTELDSKAVKEMLQPWKRYLLSRVSWPVMVGVGKIAHSFAEIPEAYRTSQECVTLLERLNGDRSGWLMFDELGIMRILAVCPDKDLETFVKEALGPLLAEGDAARVFEETLYAYLENNGNLRETARKLYIHANTLRYRLKKISELLNVDLDKMSNRVTLWTALTINRLKKPRAAGASD
ncbi:MAG TPA: PucR family transcriptional regulator [Firmicutes bacterium]|nr:PucR family transcriptional regulator [Candidatus Fermentithermobacillaceae bacterium]